MNNFLHKAFLCLALVTPFSMAHAVDWDEQANEPWGTALKDVEVVTGAHYLALGPTGIRAKYIDQSRNTMVVMYVFPNSPAAGLIQADDVITGVNGQGFQTSAIKNNEPGNDGGYSGPFQEFGEAIEEAQITDGVIPVTVLRQSQTLNFDITITMTGKFSSSWPFNCPKSDALYPKLLDFIEADMKPDFGWTSGSDHQFYCSLALLSSTDPKYFASQTGIALRYAANSVAIPDDGPHRSSWKLCFEATYLCEYYLRFKDDPNKDVAWVIPEIEECRDWLYAARYDGSHHSYFNTRDGWGHRAHIYLAGYGPFMYPTPHCMLVLGLMNRCGVTIDREAIDGPMAEMWTGTTRDNGFLWYHGNQIKPDGWMGDRARSSMAAMSMYMATTHDSLYLERANLYAAVTKDHGRGPFGFINGHGSNLAHMYALIMGERFSPKIQRRSLDAVRTWWALAETHEEGQFYINRTRDSSKSGDRRATASALLALIIAQKDKTLHVYGKGGGNGEPAVNRVPVLSGNPVTSVDEGVEYNFAPVGYDPEGNNLTYSITNKPSWATFNTATGELRGLPSNATDGTYNDIVISASDGIFTTELDTFDLIVNNVPIVTNNKVKVIILAGQSNMQGKGQHENGPTTNWNGILETLLVTEPGKYGHLANYGDVNDLIARSDVSMYYRRSSTNLKTGPLDASFGTNNNVIGPELGTGEQIGDALTEKVLIIKSAVGGTSLDGDWRPPSAGGTTGALYTAMLAEVNDALANIATHVPGYAGEGYEIAGFGWWQGWNNATSNNPTTKKEYEDLMVHLANDLRLEFNAPTMPIVIASSGNGGYDPNMPGTCIILRDVIEPAQQAAALRLNNAAYFSTRPYWRAAPAEAPYVNWSHWNYGFAAYYDIGTAMGQNFVTLMANGDAVSGNHSPFITNEPIDSFGADGVDIYTYTPTVTDYENDAITYTILGKPAWANFDSQTGTLTGTPSPYDAGDYPITVLASDGNLAATAEFVLSIYSVGLAPALDFNVVPTSNSQSGSYTISVDGKTIETFGKVDIAIDYPYTITTDTLLEFDFSSDVDANYFWIGLKDNNNNKFNFYVYGLKAARANVPDYEAGRYVGPGVEHFRYQLSDYIPTGNYKELFVKQLNQTNSQAVWSNITIYEFSPASNTAPTFTNSPQTTFVADGISVYHYIPTANDYENDPITITTQGVPSWATYNAGTGSFTGTPTLSDVGSYHIIITASDGDLTTDLVYDLMITDGNNINYPPVVDPIADDTFDADGSVYSFTPTVNDPENDTLVFSIVGKPSWATFNTSTGQISGTPSAGDVAVNNITIIVDDGTTAVNTNYVLTITYSGTTPGTPIDFSTYAINGELPHHPNRTGTQSINGTSITFTGKMDGDVALPITVTANTILEFDFSSTEEQKRHWIGIYQGSTDYNFRFAGSGNPRSGDFALTPYTGSGVQHYTVRLSDYLPLGSYDGLFIKQLGSSSTANGTWSNVKVYEATQ